MSKKDTNAPENQERREFLTSVTTAFGAAGAACAAYPFVKSLSPSADVKAQATADIDLSEIPEGSSKTYLWRGKPVFVMHRTPEQVSTAREEDGSDALLDPQPDEARVKRDKWLVVMGVCTHLGCVPMKGGQYNGWRCPCHGSQFDVSGRLRRGPASKNLEIPPYEFLDDTTIRIG